MGQNPSSVSKSSQIPNPPKNEWDISILPDYIPKIQFENMKFRRQLGGDAGCQFTGTYSPNGIESDELHVVSTILQGYSFLSESGVEFRVVVPPRRAFLVNHPNILKCYGCFEHEMRIGIVHEFCEFGDMFDFFSEQKSKDWTLEIRVKLIYDLCTILWGLESAYYPRVIPRDVVEESNIFIFFENEEKDNEDFQNQKKSENNGWRLKLRHTFLRIEKTDEEKEGFFSRWIPPEEFLLMKDRKPKSIVFLYSMIAYMILTENFELYETLELPIQFATDPNCRPKFEEEMLKSMERKVCLWLIKMIQRCWDGDVEKRLSFDEIRRLFHQKVDFRSGGVMFVDEKKDERERILFLLDQADVEHVEELVSPTRLKISNGKEVVFFVKFLF